MCRHRFLVLFFAAIALFSFTSYAISASQSMDARVAKSYGKLPLTFVENRGQMDKRARFVISGPRASAFFRNDGVTFDLWDASKKSKRDNKPEMRLHSVLKLTFKGADAKCRVKGMDMLSGKVNYMTTKDKSKWHTNIPTYKGVIYKNVWQGIDVMYHGDRRQLKYDIRVNPGANIGKVRLQYDGAEKIWLDKTGDLHVKTAVTEFIEKVPGIYQDKFGKKINVSGGYRLLNKNTVGFDVKNIDSSLPLVIDPASNVVYSTLLGGRGIEEGAGIAVDSSGCAYITGYVGGSPDFPVTPGAFRTFSFLINTFIAKMNSAGSGLIYCTCLGEADYYPGICLAIDSTGCAYLVGRTRDSNFPTTQGAFNTTNNGDNGFVIKLNASGSALIYSSLLWGSDIDHDIDLWNYSIAADSAGCAYVSGRTCSADFPTTPGAFDTTLGGDQDAFVIKINPSGSALVYSTFLGGSGYESACSIAIDSSGCAYVAGWTTSSDFPTTSGAFDKTLNHENDAFVTKLNPTGTALVYSTFLGGSSVANSSLSENATTIAVDSAGCAYAAGYTDSPDFPITSGAYDTTLGGDEDIFVTKFNASGNALLYSTFLGGDVPGDTVSYNERICSIAVDSAGSVYLGGSTYCPDFPTTEDAIDTVMVGDRAVFIAKISTTGKDLQYSSFVGGTVCSGSTGASPIAIDSSGNIYVTGSAYSNFITTPGAFDAYVGTFDFDAFILKLNLRVIKPDMLIKAGTESAYIGEGIINTDGTGQTKSQTASPNQKLTYAFKVKNGGNANDTFVITGTGGGSGWSVKYYDLITGADLTTQVIGSGWTTATLAPGGCAGLYARIIPDASVPVSSVKTLMITANSLTDATKSDVIKAVTSFAGNYKTDMLIKNGTDGSYSGTGIFSTDGSGQTKSQNVSVNQKVTCAFRARNVGNANDSFKITGTAGGSGWTVKYLDLSTGADVTSQVTGSGWLTGPIAPGIDKGVYAQIKPDVTVPLGSSITLTVTGTSIADNSKIDVVKSVTTCVASYKPDLLIKSGTEASYTGTGIFNLDGTDQTKSQSASAGQKVVYSFRVLNAGYLSDSIKITGPSGGSGWSVKYYDLNTNADVTPLVTGAGWISGILAPGGAGGVYAKVSPDTTVKSGTVNTLLITATSVGDGSKKDAVKAVTTVP